MKKRTLSFVLAVVMLLSLAVGISGCGEGSGNDDTPTSVSVCLASEPASIDPALNSAVDGATLIIHAFSGLAGYKKTASGALEVYADCATELPKAVIGDDGKATYTFTLRDGLKWSDGTDVTAEDFVYAWNRAVSVRTAADYGYMFDVIEGYGVYPENAAGTGAVTIDAEGAYVLAEDGKGAYDDVKLNVTAKDAKTLEVVLNNDVPYFYELLAFPTYMPVKKDIVEANPDGWASDPATYIGNGAYTVKEWVHDSKIVYAKNENYHNADAITADEIVFYLSDDSNNMLANFKKGDWLFIDDVPTDEIATLKTDYPNEFFIEGQLGTYYVIFNVNRALLPASNTLTGEAKELAEAEVRNALSLVFDRNYIVEEIGQAGQVPASSFVAMGLTDANGEGEFYKNANKAAGNSYLGYYDTAKEAFEGNCAAAVEVLKKYYTYDEATKKFTDFPSLTYLYNTSEGHKKIGEYLQQALAAYGITMTLENQEWNTFLETRKNGDYGIARNGWLGDYNDPISFLDMWYSDSGNNDAQFGKDAHAALKCYSVDLNSLGIDYKVENGTWKETYDYVIGLVKSTSDPATRYGLMHVAEDLLMETGAIVPLYYYTDIFMCSEKLEGTFASPLGYKYFMYATVK